VRMLFPPEMPGGESAKILKQDVSDLIYLGRWVL